MLGMVPESTLVVVCVCETPMGSWMEFAAGPCSTQVAVQTSARSFETLVGLEEHTVQEYRRLVVGSPAVVIEGEGRSYNPFVASEGTCSRHLAWACLGDRRVGYTHCSSGWSMLTSVQIRQQLVKDQLSSNQKVLHQKGLEGKGVT
jgi:hypothetical protein